MFETNKNHFKGITASPSLAYCKVIFKIVHESAPARSSDILSYSDEYDDPPNIKTPLPSGDFTAEPGLLCSG